MFDETPFKVKKCEHAVNTDKYFLTFDRNGASFGWALFFIDETTGAVCAMTDWGNYSYMWPRHGRKSLKHFLIELDTGYVAGKFCGNPAKVDIGETAEAMKKELFMLRRECNIEPDIARDCFDEIECMDRSLDSPDAFWLTMPSNVLSEVYGDDYQAVPVKMTYTGWQQRFIFNMFPAFQQVLRDQLETSKGDTNNEKADKTKT